MKLRFIGTVLQYDISKIYRIGSIYIYLKIPQGGYFKVNKKPFNLQTKQGQDLARIYSFYEVLSGIDNKKEEILMYSADINYFKWDNLDGSEDQGDNMIGSDYDEDEEGSKFSSGTIFFSYSNYQNEYLKLPIPKDPNNSSRNQGELSFPEFFLLMQIYFGVYKEAELQSQLEENERKGKYEIVKEKMWEAHETHKEDFIEYYKLQLMKKDISGAFGDLEIKKIYDKDWSDEEKKKYVEEIKEEYGEEVVELE